MYVIVSRKTPMGSSYRKATDLLVVTKVPEAPIGTDEGQEEIALQTALNQLADGDEPHTIIQVLWKA